jgi:hypothetical protein
MAQKFHMPTQLYLGMNLDVKLRWKEHIKKKRDELNIKFRKMYCIVLYCIYSAFKTKCIGCLDEILSCQYTINSHYPSKLYVQFGVMVSSSRVALVNLINIQVIQRNQNKVLKCIVNAPWYFRNSDLHRDLGIEIVTDIIAKFAKSHEKRLQGHINIEASRLLNVNNITRRLTRKKPYELVIR